MKNCLFIDENLLKCLTSVELKLWAAKKESSRVIATQEQGGAPIY